MLQILLKSYHHQPSCLYCECVLEQRCGVLYGNSGINRCMYQVLVIQLHYPLIARNRSQPATPARIGESYSICATAAKQIVLILYAYNHTFSIRKAPYLIAYAAYVSATVHVRVAAQQAPDAETLSCLRTCLSWLSQNQQTNPGVGNAIASLTSLMRRMGVVCPEDPGSYPYPEELGEHSLSQYPMPRNQSDSLIANSSPETSFSSIRTPLFRERTNSSPYAPFDMDMVLRRLASGQSLGSSPLNAILRGNTSPAQYDPAASFRGFEISPIDAFDSGLLDPVGMSYEPASVAGGEQLEPFAGPTAAGSDMGYPMAWHGNNLETGRGE